MPLLYPKEVCNIDTNVEIDSSNFGILIPQGFDKIIKASFEDNDIVITCLNPENSYIDNVKISSVLFNNHKHLNASVPKGFIFTESLLYSHLDYFGANNNLVLNIRQIIYMILQHRFDVWSRYEKQYVDLLNTDIKNLRCFIEYNPPNTYNAQIKVNNSFVVINYHENHVVKDKALGEYIHETDMDENDWSAFMRDVVIDISSETAMSSSNKVTILQENQELKFVGYSKGVDENGVYINTIFPPKQNLPARLKTHGISNAYKLDNPDFPIFIQHLQTVKDNNGLVSIEPLDPCLKKAIIVFDSMDQDTYRFVSGEIESSLNIANTLVHIVKKIDIDFINKEDPLKVNQKYVPNFKPIQIGLNVDQEPIMLYDVREFTVLDLYSNGSNGSLTLVLDLVIKAGNARIISDTGLKGVTKTKPNCGFIEIVKPNTTKPNLTSSVRNYLKDHELTEYPALHEETQTISVDLIAGMNAVKANDNTIALAMAAFAVEYGYYIPRDKMGFKGLLNSKDINEINEAVASVPDFKFIDEFGEERKVHFGLVHIMYTELGEIYANFKKQSFAFEAGKNILFNDPKMYNHIWENYLDQDNVDLALELSKCLFDQNCYLNKVETEVKLPLYDVKTIRQLFKPIDLILRKTDMFLSSSRLLDESWNTKGFYIDLSKYKAPVIRVPSAKILNQMVGSLKDGNFTYHAIIVNISRIISNIIGTEKNPNPSIPFIYDPTGKRHTSLGLYLKSLKGTIFSDDEASQMKIQSLIKPQIYGVNMKQVVEHRLPENTIVIMDDYIYKKICNIASNSDNDKIFKPVDENATLMEILTKDCPHVYVTHSPHLWVSQSFTPVIWDRHTYSLYLKTEHNIDLDDYLYTRTNSDIALIHPLLALKAKKDI